MNNVVVTVVVLHSARSVVFTNDVAFKVIKVDVTPTFRAVIYKSNASVLINQVLDVPALMIHRLGAVTSLSSDNLKRKEIYALVRRKVAEPELDKKISMSITFLYQNTNTTTNMYGTTIGLYSIEVSVCSVLVELSGVDKRL